MKEQFAAILSLLNVEAKHIKEDDKKDEALIFGELNRRDVLVKIVTLSNTSKVSGIEKEALVNNIINKHNSDLRLPYIFVGKVLALGRNEDYAWIIRSFYKGRSLSKIKDNVVLMGYDILPRKYQLNRKDVIDQIVYNIDSLRTLEMDSEDSKTSLSVFKERFEKKLEDYSIKEIEEGLSINLEKQINFYNKNAQAYYKNSNIKATLGDLVPANIILKNDKQLIFTDFEWFCFDNYMMDVTFLWTFLWRYPDWQKYLLEKSVITEKDKIFFRMCLIRQIIGKYDLTFRSVIKRDEIRIGKLKKHIWSKYLVAAGDSFEAILKVKK